MDLAEISTITPYTISHEAAGGGNASSFLPVAVPRSDPGFRLRGRNFKHAPRIVLSRPSREIDFSADPLEDVPADACDAEMWNEGLIFLKFVCIVFAMELFSDEYGGENLKHRIR